MVTIDNGILTARIHEKGAELSGLFHSALALEYIWNANPRFWAKSSPILFPIVGALKSNCYHYDGATYSLPRHGFARDEVFVLESQTSSDAVFRLSSSNALKSHYPFDFELRVSYKLDGDTLTVGYSVDNTGTGPMYFSLGAHPAFNVPLVAGTAYSDYYLQFSEVESADRWVIAEGGLIDSPEPCLLSTDRLPLAKTLFQRDALVFKSLKSRRISLLSESHSHGLHLGFDGFPYVGIWAAPDADFVCLEPWCGIADSVHHNQQLTDKEGIEILEKHGHWRRSWTVKCF